MNTPEIANRLVALCRELKWEVAQKELYAQDVVSIEPYVMPGTFDKETRGLPAIIEKGHKFAARVETMHSLTVSDPIVAANSFACTMTMDVTMKGQGRMNTAELCVYEVKDGKVISESFHV
ncbi:MAG: SnoaL-like domain-containing protein [Opitutus sp.]